MAHHRLPLSLLRLVAYCCCFLWLLLLPHPALATLKVFIVAGQSNGAGHAHAEHLRELINTTESPKWAP
jgi:hypothetical protein